jgi:hypothetical protein
VNPGLGGNLAYEGIARLTNGLIALLKEYPTPSLSRLNQVFDSYIAGQKPRAESVVNLSGQITRYEAQDTWILKFAAKNIVPWVSDNLKAQLYASFSRGGPWLEYLPLPAGDRDLMNATQETSRLIPSLITAGLALAAAAALLCQRWN